MTDEKKIPQRIYINDSQLTQCEVDGVADVRINATPFKTQNGKLCEYVSLKALWHTEDEVPKSGKLILVKGWYTNVRSEDYTLINTDIDLNYDDIASCDQKLRWECFCESAKGNLTWCYIDDLLPKKFISSIWNRDI